MSEGNGDKYVTWKSLHEWLDITRNDLVAAIDKHMTAQAGVCDLKMGQVEDKVTANTKDIAGVKHAGMGWIKTITVSALGGIISIAGGVIVYVLTKGWPS